MNVDDSTFEQAVSTYYASLYRFALSLTNREADASDLTQETFSRLAEKGHQLRERSKLKTWLFTTLYREYLRQWQLQSRFRHVELSELQSQPSEARPAIDDQIDGATARQALVKLDELHRAPLVLFYLQEHSYAEIAEILNIPTGTVMSRISRGRDLLRKLLEDKAPQGSDTIVPLKKFSKPKFCHE